MNSQHDENVRIHAGHLLRNFEENMQLANVKMKEQPLYFDWLVHYCLLMLEMDTLGKDIVDNNLPMTKLCISQFQAPTSPGLTPGEFF